MPRLQPKALPRPLTFGVFEFLDEVDSAQSGFLIEIPSLVERTVEIGVVTLDGEPDIFADGDRTGAYLIGIEFGGIFLVGFHYMQ